MNVQHKSRFYWQFIKHAAVPAATPSNDLISGKDIQEYRWTPLLAPKPHLQVRLVEIPGFENTSLQDEEITSLLATYLSKTRLQVIILPVLHLIKVGARPCTKILWLHNDNQQRRAAEIYRELASKLIIHQVSVVSNSDSDENYVL